MRTSNILKTLLVACSFSFLLNGCSATLSSPTSERLKPSTPASPPLEQEQPSAQQEAAKTEASSRDSKGGSSFGHRDPQDSPAVTIDNADREFVQSRLMQYENKFEHWMEVSEMDHESDLLAEVANLESECIQNLERILTGYSLLLERMKQSDTVTFDKFTTVSPTKMQQLDIAFLESRCGQLLAMDLPAMAESTPEGLEELSFAAAQKTIVSDVEQGNYQDAILAYANLSQAYPEQTFSPATQLNYGIALQFSGQVEAAARHFKSMLESGELSIEPLTLQREIADLLLASNNVAAAEAYYENFILAHESIGAEKKWAEEQLAFLRSIDPGSDDMSAYMKLLRDFQMYDYRVYAAELNEKANSFAAEYAGSPVAVSALRLKAFKVDQLRAWFGRQLLKIDSLVAEKKFTEATDILKNMSRFYLPAELQAVVQKTYYEVSQAEIEAIETQRRIQEMELTEQWGTAMNLLDSQRYDIAITAFEALLGTEYEEKAKMKIIEAANQAASQMRKEAAALFIRAGKTSDLEQKKELLLASHRMLTEILVRFPQTELSDKVQQNIEILETQIQRFDPALLEQLQQEKAAGLQVEPPQSYPAKTP